MAYTDHDTIARLLLPAVAEIVPGKVIERERRVDYALDAGGKIRAGAVRLSGAIAVNGILDDTLYSTSSTTDYTVCGRLYLELSVGTWTVHGFSTSRITNTSGSNVDYRMAMQTTAITDVTRPAVAAGASPFNAYQRMSGVDGGITFEVRAEYKSDTTGTSAASDTVIVGIAIREN
jgi:hypothetical protein